MVLVAQLEEQQPGRRRRKAPKPVRDPIWTADGLRVRAAAAGLNCQKALQSGLQEGRCNSKSSKWGLQIATRSAAAGPMSRLRGHPGAMSLRLQRPSGWDAGLLPALHIWS